METKRFSKNDSGFVCGHCGKDVPPLKVTSRNHCPYCLWSKHLDENPGDRLSGCMGLMEPVEVVPDAKKGYIITHKCTVCGAMRRNKAAYGPKINVSDNLKLLIELTGKK